MNDEEKKRKLIPEGINFEGIIFLLLALIAGIITLFSLMNSVKITIGSYPMGIVAVLILIVFLVEITRHLLNREDLLSLGVAIFLLIIEFYVVFLNALEYKVFDPNFYLVMLLSAFGTIIAFLFGIYKFRKN